MRIRILYNIHREEKGKWVVPFIRPKLGRNPNISFERMKHEGLTLGESRALDLKKRYEAIKKSKKENFFPIEIHTTPKHTLIPGKNFDILYGLRGRGEEIAEALQKRLEKKGFKVGIKLKGHSTADLESISVELPGKEKDAIYTHRDKLYPEGIKVSYKKTIQTLGQHRVSKKFLIALIKELEKMK